jgi:glutamate/tyrosine decarboxylase-like PLP-dependent enzyme
VERQGLIGAPAVRVLAGAERHATIDRSLRLLGLGTEALVPVPCDGQGRVAAGAMAAALSETSGPTIVSLQAGNVNTGSFDPIDEIVDAAHAAGAWVHVDGAFGLWAGAASGRRALVHGIERCDSWSTDGHKWLNVPYDCGLVFCAHPDSHRAAFTMAAAYLVPGGGREPWDWSPEASRRARVFPVWAALRSLGRSGVADLVERCCRLAERFASRLAAEGFTIGNEVVLNQVLVAAADDDATLTLAGALQADGTAWAGTTVWQGRAWIRISVSSWATTEADVDATVAALARLAGSTRA